MPILLATDYDQVRAAIDVDLTPDVLPDATIAMDIFQGRAEDAVIAAYPEAETAADPAAVHVRRAVIYLTAALILPSLYAVSDEQVGDLRVKINDSRIDQRVASLRNMVDEELGLAVGGSPVAAPSGMPVMFDLAYAGVRSWEWPEP